MPQITTYEEYAEFKHSQKRLAPKSIYPIAIGFRSEERMPWRASLLDSTEQHDERHFVIQKRGNNFHILLEEDGVENEFIIDAEIGKRITTFIVNNS